MKKLLTIFPALKYTPWLIMAAIPAMATENATNSIPEIIVTADFRPDELQKTAASLTVFSEKIIQSRSAQHLEDILNLAPNVNFASGSSRARYFQIRGIGERSQFAQPISPSVGFVIDEIDFSGLGTAATMFDVEQVEVLRGPQGTRYGANALAGLIKVRTKAPTESLDANIEATIADYGSYSLGAAIGGPLVKDKLLGRVAVQGYRSDGFMENIYLGRDDTNDRDEVTARGKLRLLAGDNLAVDFSLLYVDIDNGYDAFSLDNNRKTRSDEPGHDRQQSTAFGVDMDWSLNAALRLEMLASIANSDLEYGYDEDWTYVGFDPWEYSSVDNYVRDRDSYSLEVRLLSDEDGKIFNGTTDWVIGIYQLQKDEQLDRQYTYLSENYNSNYDTDNRAIYGQLNISLSDKLTLITGLRFEQWAADYTDSEDLNIDTNEDLWGGKLGLDYQFNDQHMAYGSFSRGYKAGGVNTDGSLPEVQRKFDTEYLWNLEGGIKSRWMNDSLYSQISVFYAKREEQQVKGSYLIYRNDGSPEFVDYIANAAKGNNYGLEAELTWQASRGLQVFANMGLLQTELDQYITPDGDDKSGRDQAHAPRYQFALGGEYSLLGGWYVRAEMEGKDSFYFSDRHDEKSTSYHLFNARLGYRSEQWSVALWGRNLLDKEYQTRGFGFANDPRDFYSSGGYYQLGEPRVIGATLSWNL